VSRRVVLVLVLGCSCAVTGRVRVCRPGRVDPLLSAGGSNTGLSRLNSFNSFNSALPVLWKCHPFPAVDLVCRDREHWHTLFPHIDSVTRHDDAPPGNLLPAHTHTHRCIYIEGGTHYYIYKRAIITSARTTTHTDMFRIAKNLVKTFEQSVQGLAQDGSQLDSYFQSIPPNLLAIQVEQHEQNTMGDMGSFSNSVSGLRVVWVDEWQLQLQSYFDYIVGLNDVPLPLMRNQHGYMYPDYNAIIELLNTYCNSSVKLNVWSAKGGVFRDIYIQLSPKDESQMDDVSLSNGPLSANGIVSGTEPNNAVRLFQALGFKVQWTSLIAATYTYHILQLNISNGPAQMAGLIPDEDYIIGCQDGLLATGGDTLLQDIVRSRAGQDLVLYVYNKVSDSVRPITVRIATDGRLGCGIGSGYLHRIPAVKQQEMPQTMPQTLPPIDPANTFVPSNINDPLPPMASTHKKKKHTTAATNIMSDYFTEGKDQSPKPASTPVDVTPPPMSAEKL